MKDKKKKEFEFKPIKLRPIEINNDKIARDIEEAIDRARSNLNNQIKNNNGSRN